MADGSKAVGLFNRDDREARPVAVRWSDLGLKGRCRVRDLWRQKDLGAFDGKFEATVLVHGAVLLRLTPQERQ
jgi:alpha-galactosidase